MTAKADIIQPIPTRVALQTAVEMPTELADRHSTTVEGIGGFPLGAKTAVETPSAASGSTSTPVETPSVASAGTSTPVAASAEGSGTSATAVAA